MDSFLDLPIRSSDIPLSYGLEGLIAKSLSNGEEFDISIIYECACEVHPRTVVDESIQDLSERFISRVRRLSEESQSEDKEQPPVPARTFGAALEEWSKTLTPTESCLLLADFDPSKARHLFWYEEADILEVALKAKLRYLSTRHSGSFEAVLYGFGGKYASDSSSQMPPTHDSQEADLNTSEGLAELHAFGF